MVAETVVVVGTAWVMATAVVAEAEAAALVDIAVVYRRNLQ